MAFKKLAGVGAETIEEGLGSASITKRLKAIENMKDVGAKNKEFYGARAQEVRATRTKAKLDEYINTNTNKTAGAAADDIDIASEVLENGGVGTKNGLGGFMSDHPVISAGIAGGAGFLGASLFDGNDE